MWNGDRGAATFCNGTHACTGTLSSANSLVGTTPQDRVGVNDLYPAVLELANGNYIVISAQWANGSFPVAGAITWGSGQVGVIGEVSPSNSIVGGVANEHVQMAYPLANGNYVVTSSGWNDRHGAVRLGDGNGGTHGVFTEENSLVGNISGDDLGDKVTPLPNGNFVVSSSAAKLNGIYGVTTFCRGVNALTGPISPSNSLIGTSSYGLNSPVAVLTNGNYVILSR